MATSAISPSHTFQSMASSSSTHTKIKLPMEEAVKADFPPGCKVLCFDDNGFRVGVVKNVMVSISLPSKHMFGTFYEVELKSNTSMDSKILGVFSQSDLRLTPGCPVEVDSKYFGSVFKFSGGTNRKVPGTIIGSFEVPPSSCARCSTNRTDEAAPVIVRKFYYSVRVKFHGMEEAVEAHGVPPDHISVPTLYSSSQQSDNSTILSEVPGSIFFGGGTFEVLQAQPPSQLVVQVGDDYKENNTRDLTRPSPSVSRMKSKQRLTPEDLPLQNSAQFNFKSSAMDGTLDDSLNVMYQHENNTKTFGNIIANGHRAIYDSESGSSFEDRRGGMDSAPIASPRKQRGRSSSRSREQSQLVHRSRSSSRTRVYVTSKAGSVRSVAPNMIPRDPTSRRQINMEMSQSSSVDSMNDYENEDKKYQYDVGGEDMGDDELVERQGSQKMNRDLVNDSDEEYEDREDAGSEPTPRSRTNRDIARFLTDEEDYDRNGNLELEGNPMVSHPTTPSSSASNRKKKFGKSWSPKVLSNGEPIDAAELKREQSQSSFSAMEQERESQINLESPSPKRENFQRSASSMTQSTDVPAEPLSSTEGCYLVFDPASGGKLTMQYSKTVVNGAIGFWTPGRGKKIQGFKFKQNQGRSDLMKNIAGKDYKKKYFNGWCQFVKAAKMYAGFVCKWSEHERIETDIFVFYSDSCEVKKIEDGELFDVADIDAVSSLPRGNATFDGVKTGEYGTFLNRGDAAGASTAL